MNTRTTFSVLSLAAAVALAGCDNATPNKAATPAAPSKGAGQVAGPKTVAGAPAAGPKPNAEPPKPAVGTLPAVKPEQPATKPATGTPAGTGATTPAVTPPAATPPKPAETPKPTAPPSTPPKEPQVLETIDKNGVLIEVLNYGSGAEARPGGWVKMHYRGTLVDGTEFDSSYKRQQPLEQALTGLIKGWQEGIPGMKVGGKRRLTIPPDLGYGGKDIRDGQGKVIIPANSMLIFEVELLDAK